MKKIGLANKINIPLALLLNLLFLLFFIIVIPHEEQFFTLQGRGAPHSPVDLTLDGYQKSLQSNSQGDFQFDKIPAYGSHNRLELSLREPGASASKKLVLFEKFHGSAIHLSGLLALLFLINSLLLAGALFHKESPRSNGLTPQDFREAHNILYRHLHFPVAGHTPEQVETTALTSLLNALQEPAALYYGWNKTSARYERIFSLGEPHFLLKDGLIFGESNKIKLKNSHVDLSATLMECGSFDLSHSFKSKPHNFHASLFPGFFQEGFPRRLLIILNPSPKLKRGTSGELVLHNFLEILRQNGQSAPEGREGENSDHPEDGIQLYPASKFQAILNREVERCERYHLDMILALVKIDQFEKVKKAEMQEAVLRFFLQALKKGTRQFDVICRHGEEGGFAVLLTACIEKDALAIFERIRQNVEANISKIADGKNKLTMSCGLAGYPQNSTLASNLVEKVETTLEEASRKGNRVVSYTNLYGPA